MKVLAGDIGGTNARLAVCDVTEGTVLRVVEEIQPSTRFKTFKEIVREFVAKHDVDLRGACFGLPGPVRGRSVSLTNLPWTVDADELERDLGLPNVRLVNDLVANAYGLETLTASDFHTLREGVPDPMGNVGLIAAGTGLGQAGLHRVHGTLIPFGTEGGHTDFSPTNAVECDLLEFLQRRHGDHISWERVVSGPGLTSVYDFLRERAPSAEPAWLREELASAHDPSAVIGRHAITERSELAAEAVNLFLGLYGAEASNLALKLLATGGMYLGGGIAPKLRPAFAESPFLQRFNHKGRMRAVVEAMPIRIVLDDKAALQGAALHAARTASSSSS